MGGIKLLDSQMVDPLKEGENILVRIGMKMFYHRLTMLSFSAIVVTTDSNDTNE